MRRLWALAAVLLPLYITSPGQAADSPSFDCAKAASPIEKRICADPGLAARDRSLAETYQQLLDISGNRRDRLVLDQRLWLRVRPIQCPQTAADRLGVCLAKSYDQREEALTEWTQSISQIRTSAYMDEGLDFVDSQILRDAFRYMGEDPTNAERIFRQFDTAQAKIGLAMLLRLTTPHPETHTAEIGKLLVDGSNEIAEKNGAFDYLIKDAGEKLDKVKDLVGYIHAVGENINISCLILKKYPELIESMDREIYIGSDERAPSATCDTPDFPGSVRRLETMIQDYDGGYFARCGMSNPMNKIRYWTSRRVFLVSQVAPQYLVEKEKATPNDERTKWLLDPSSMPLRGWPYLGAWNHAQYQRVHDEFLTTQKDLALYFQSTFGLTEADSREAAHLNLMSNFWWTMGWAPPINVAIMDADAKPSLVDLLAAGKPMEVKDEPLLSLAVVRPAAIAPLLAAHAPVDGVNPMGKTPLMTAAQFNSLEATQQLLKAGAAVNLQSLPPDAIGGNDTSGSDGCAPYHITHGQRTALMYAAANAGLPVIQALLAAGADTRPRDSQGATALDYLEGRGPVPANPVLSGEERETARRLLTPPAH